MPLILYGLPGCGKTSLMSVASVRAFDWLGNGYEVMAARRFVGTTPESSNISALLHSITKQIGLYCG